MRMKNNVKGKPAKGIRWCNTCKLMQPDKKTGKNKFIVLTIAMGYHKAKLGFDIKTGDSDFYANSVAIAAAIRLNVSGYYSPMFEDIDLLDEQNEKFGKSIVDVKLGGLGKVGIKNSLKTILKGTLDDALGYINKLSRNNKEHSEAIATGAKFLIHGSRGRFKKYLEAKRGSIYGDVKVTTIAEKIDGKYVRTLYNWQNSIDGGKTWSEPVNSFGAKYTFKNMKDSPTLFRKRSHTSKGGWSAWCPPVGITSK